MNINPLSIGDSPSLDEILINREKRAQWQETLALKYTGKILITFNLNIPGPVKTNKLIIEAFTNGIYIIKKEFREKQIDVIYEKVINENTGPIAFFIIEGDLKGIKRLMILIEEKILLGRLYDLDVMTAKDNVMHYISRKDLNLPERKCLICGKPAKVCGRSRAHSVETMQEKIYNLIGQAKKESLL